MKSKKKSLEILDFLLKFFSLEFIIYNLMKKISNREDANYYFKLVNQLVDKFIGDTKATPNEIFNYINRNISSFILKNELGDVFGIEKIIKDVINHRKNMEDDKVITFESYSRLNENKSELNNLSIEKEKFLADYYNVSLSHIDLVNSDMSLYSINDFGKIFFVVLLSDLDLTEIKDHLKKEMELEINDSSITSKGLKFWVSEFVNTELLDTYIDSKITNEQIFKVVSDNVFSLPVSQDFSSVTFTTKLGPYYLFLVS